MSLYDLAAGDGLQAQRAEVLLPILGNPTVLRWRDAWAEKGEDGPVIAVYTRQGGGNRECYCGEPEEHVPGACYAACNEALQAHPLYLRDADDGFDSTYATFYFRAPDDPQVGAALEETAVDPVDTSARWQEAIARVARGEISPGLRAAAGQLAAALNDLSPGAPRIVRI